MEKLGKNKNRLDKKTQDLEGLQYKKQQIDAQDHKVSSRIESLDSKCRIYEELLMSREGYPNGAKDILENKDQYKGVLGKFLKNFAVFARQAIVDIGFKEKETNKIFKRFYSNRPEKFGEHSGLGLNIVKNLIDLHGGIINATNNPSGKGAKIEIIFPGT